MPYQYQLLLSYTLVFQNRIPVFFQRAFESNTPLALKDIIALRNNATPAKPNLFIDVGTRWHGSEETVVDCAIFYPRVPRMANLDDYAQFCADLAEYGFLGVSQPHPDGAYAKREFASEGLVINWLQEPMVPLCPTSNPSSKGS